MSNDAEDYTSLVDLESRFVHAEQALQDLSDVIRKQWDEIDSLKRLVRRLDDRTSELEQRPNSHGGAEDEKPPHY